MMDDAIKAAEKAYKIAENWTPDSDPVVSSLRSMIALAKELREALKPFADACDRADDFDEERLRLNMGVPLSDAATPGWGIRYKHLKAARALLDGEA